MRPRRIPAVLVMALIIVLAAQLTAWAGQGSQVGPGTGGGQNEARSGWDTLPPADGAQLDRDRDCAQDRLRDGSCTASTDGGVQVQARTRAQGGGPPEEASVRGGAVQGSAAGGEEARAQAREQARVRDLVRLEARLRLLDGPQHAATGSASFAEVALRLMERLRVWLGAS
jgi:hypothetical protein